MFRAYLLWMGTSGHLANDLPTGVQERYEWWREFVDQGPWGRYKTRSGRWALGCTVCRKSLATNHRSAIRRHIGNSMHELMSAQQAF
jgi:hypothetical protein